MAWIGALLMPMCRRARLTEFGGMDIQLSVRYRGETGVYIYGNSSRLQEGHEPTCKQYPYASVGSMCHESYDHVHADIIVKAT